MSRIRGITVFVHRNIRQTSRNWSLSTSQRCLSTEDKHREARSLVPSSARVVICGGGVLGTSVAYHLAERGCTDVVLLEQGRLTCGTTWHSAGLIGQLGKDDAEGCKLIGYGLQLYKEFEKRYGIGWKQCGSLLLAQTKDRLVTIQRKHSLAKAIGIETHLVSPSEIQDLCSWIKTSDLQGGLWVPGDGVISPNDLVYAYNSEAKSKGIQVLEGVQINTINTKDGRVSGVQTSHGTIDCEYFVNCSGQWARHLGAKSCPPVRVPLHSNEHFYIVSSAIKDMDTMMPVVRDYDGSIYAREWSGGILAGGFELEGKPTFSFGVPDKFEFQLLPSDWDHFQVMLEPIMNRFPAMETAEVRTLVNGPESFTPDGNWNVGESAEVKNYYVAAGMNGLGVVGSAGIGKYITECIVDGMPSASLDAHHIMRHNKVHGNRRFLFERVKEVIGAYKLRYPNTQWTKGRKLKTSPLHTILEKSGACFQDFQGFERPSYFRDTDDLSHDSYHIENPTFRKPSWIGNVRTEYKACKENVCLIDTTAFAKCEVKSSRDQAFDFLQRICCNDISGEVGRVTETGMLNEKGGYVVDCSICTLDSNRFYITAATNHQRKMLTWLSKHLPEDGSVEVIHNNSSLSSLSILGPKSEQVLQDFCSSSMTLKDLRPMTCKTMDTGIIVMRVPMCGVEAFTLHIPTEQTLHVYEALKEAGQQYGIKDGGHFILKNLRLENSIPSQEEDISSLTTPFECGKDDQVCLQKKQGFIGKDALQVQNRDGVHTHLVQCILTDHNSDLDIWPWGGEPIYRNGQFVGSVSSCGYSYDLEKVVCLGYVKLTKNENCNNIVNYIMDKNSKYEIAVGTHMYALDVKV